MSDSSRDLSIETWKERLAPHLSSSLREASEAMTSAAPVQAWLHEASFEAAQDVAHASGSQAQGMGYLYMIDTLETTVPNLLAAVRELTDGCGRVDLHWRPLSPSFSRLYIDFDWDASVDVFVRLTDATPEAVRNALRTVADALPGGRPYPNRPNEATGVVTHDGHGVAVRVLEHAGETDTTYRTVVVLPKDGDPTDPVSPNQALRAVQSALRDA
jgi:hypothetical protein